MAHSRKHLFRLLLSMLLLATPASAADLIEPWDPGFTDLELFVGFARGGETLGATTLGFGLGGGVSAGLSLARGDEPDSVGFSLVWSRALGGLGDLDLFAFAHSTTSEAELDWLDHAAGFEWSAPAGGAQPYVRATVLREDGATRVHPLVGLRLPVGRADLHLELSSMQPAEGGPWPLHLAVGPNWQLADGLELLPELSLIWNRAEDRFEPGLALTWIASPAALRRRAPGASAQP